MFLKEWSPKGLDYLMLIWLSTEHCFRAYTNLKRKLITHRFSVQKMAIDLVDHWLCSNHNLEFVQSALKSDERRVQWV